MAVQAWGHRCGAPKVGWPRHGRAGGQAVGAAMPKTSNTACEWRGMACQLEDEQKHCAAADLDHHQGWVCHNAAQLAAVQCCIRLPLHRVLALIEGLDRLHVRRERQQGVAVGGSGQATLLGAVQHKEQGVPQARQLPPPLS